MKHKCPNCNEEYDVLDLNNMNCPKCGFRELTLGFNATLSLDNEFSLSFRSIAKEKSDNSNRKRYLFEGFDRVENSELYKKKIQRYQKIDRIQNEGTEIITDLKKNNVLYYKKYVLSEHKGHGSDKLRIISAKKTNANNK